jgi:hypothetical protein
MKKRWLLIPVVFFVITAAYAQNTASPVMQMDEAVKVLAQDIHKKLVEGNAQKVILGQFSYRGTIPPFSSYWSNQLVGELTNISGKPYVILSEGTAGADRIISGEIVDVTNIIRVYSRLIRAEGRTVEAVFQSDFERTAALNTMFASGSGSGSSPVFPDEYETDSWDSPFSVEIGSDSGTPPVNRTLTDGDEDFFLLVPESSGRLVMETTGNLDTYMHFYNYETRNELATNDDGGSGSNARIRQNVQAGTRYLAKVRGYDSSTTGNYGFRAYMIPPREGANSWENPLTYEPGANENVTAMDRTIQDGGDEDYFLIVPASSGRLVMETTGNLDTYMHFYNYETKEELATNDDGGHDSNARIRQNVQAGTRYLAKVRGYGSSTSGNYGFRAYMIPPREGSNSWEKPLTYEPGTDENAAAMSRSFQDDNDEDYFLIVPDRSGNMTIETTGRMDTYMELYDYNTKEKLDEDDDSGQSYNARIRYSVQAGTRYLVKIRELDGGTGNYSLRAWIR